MLFNRRMFLTTILSSGLIAATTPALAAGLPDRYQMLVALQTDLYAFQDSLTVHTPPLAALWPDTPEPNFDAFTSEEYRARYLAREQWRKYQLDRMTALAPAREKDRAAMKAAMPEINVKADKIIAFLMAEFGERVSTDANLREQVRKLFDRELQIDVMSEDDLRRVEGPVVGIAVIKHMLSARKLPLNPQLCTSFNAFATAYRDLIL